jgi:hypothetical protein
VFTVTPIITPDKPLEKSEYHSIFSITQEVRSSKTCSARMTRRYLCITDLKTCKNEHGKHVRAPMAGSQTVINDIIFMIKYRHQFQTTEELYFGFTARCSCAFALFLPSWERLKFSTPA